MKNIALIALLLIISRLCLYSQHSSEMLIGAGGASVQNASLQTCWSIGEIVIESFDNDHFLITQGIHQINYAVTKVPPVVESSEPLVLSINSATIGGIVISSGGAIVTERGIYWGELPEASVTGTKLIIGDGTGLFEHTISELTPGTTYYFVAFATNSEGTSFGDELSFCTIVLPTVITAEPDEITGNSAIVGGEVICDGGTEVIERGIYWSLEPDPEITGSKLSMGANIGVYSMTLELLEPATVYYLKSYAINSEGIAYGQEFSFKTLSAPIVSTLPAFDITQTSARLGGIIIDDGDDEISDRGVYLGTTTDPVNDGVQHSFGLGNGEFFNLVENLEPSTEYFFRAYASNSVGTSFGDLKNFETLESEGVPSYLWLDDLIITPDKDTCFSAIETITVAGNGNEVVVATSGFMRLVAGQSIILLNGFKVQSGGNFEAWIDTNGDYCINYKSLIASSTEETDHLDSFQPLNQEPDLQLYKVFPNPTAGRFTIELLEAPDSSVEIIIFSTLGEIIFNAELYGNQSFNFDLTGKPQGVYFVRVLKGNQTRVEKLIKR